MGKKQKKIHMQKYRKEPTVCPRCGNEVRRNQYTCYYCRYHLIERTSQN